MSNELDGRMSLDGSASANELVSGVLDLHPGAGRQALVCLASLLTKPKQAPPREKALSLAVEWSGELISHLTQIDREKPVCGSLNAALVMLDRTLEEIEVGFVRCRLCGEQEARRELGLHIAPILETDQPSPEQKGEAGET